MADKLKESPSYATGTSVFNPSAVIYTAKKWVAENGKGFIDSQEWNISPDIMRESVEGLGDNPEIVGLLEDLGHTYGEEEVSNLLVSAITYGLTYELPEATKAFWDKANRTVSDRGQEWGEDPANFPLIEKWLATGTPQEGIPIEFYGDFDAVGLSKSDSAFGKLIRAVQNDMNVRNTKAFKEKYGYDLPED